MRSDIRILSLASILALVVLAFVLSASCNQSDDIQSTNAQICFPEGSDVLVSNSNTIPNMEIVETKHFVMVSQSGLGPVCEAAVAFIEEVNRHGGNAVVGFSSMVVTGPTPLSYIVFHGTAVVVEPVDD